MRRSGNEDSHCHERKFYSLQKNIMRMPTLIYLHILPEGPDHSVKDSGLKPVEKGLADTDNAETAKELKHLWKLATIDSNLPIVN